MSVRKAYDTQTVANSSQRLFLALYFHSPKTQTIYTMRTYLEMNNPPFHAKWLALFLAPFDKYATPQQFAFSVYFHIHHNNTPHFVHFALKL
jgi:hypothetical protein